VQLNNFYEPVQGSLLVLRKSTKGRVNLWRCENLFRVMGRLRCRT